MNNNYLWVLAEEEVIRLGIPSKNKGYYYLIFAVMFSIESGFNKVSLGKDIYCRIAAIHDVSSQSVEKCIRNCVIKAWSDKNGPMRGQYHPSNRKPTNSELIAYISSRIRLETAQRIW